MNTSLHYYMDQAIEEAHKAYDLGEVPVGCIIVENGNILARTHNTVEKDQQCTSHAEILALQEATKKKGSKYLSDCTLFVTLEPCPMCAAAISWSKIPLVVFGAMDEKIGACGTRYTLHQEKGFNHTFNIVQGIREDECRGLIKAFFESKR